MKNQDPRYGSVCALPDGRPGVRFDRVLAHAVAEVWAAIVDADRRAVWMPGIRFEPRLNGRFEIWFGDACEGPAHLAGTVAAFERERLLQLGTIRFELRRGPAADRGDRNSWLRFSDVLAYDGKRSTRAFENAVLGGWHQFLDRLKIYLAEGRSAFDLPEPDYAAVDVARDVAGPAGSG